jgi:hypothetical protein
MNRGMDILTNTVGALILTATFLAVRPVLAGRQERPELFNPNGRAKLVHVPSAEPRGLGFDRRFPG